LLKEDFENLTHDELKQYVDVIHQSSNYLYNFVKNLLYWSRSQQNKINPVPKVLRLKEDISRILVVHQQMAGNKGIGLVNMVSEDIRVFVDKNLLDAILRNLISNALKFSFSGKKVEVIATQKEDTVQITVKDQGVGMDTKSVETLFDPERKIKSKGTHNEEGTGLGLLIVKEFVEKSNGTIRVESVPGKGTSFILTFPSGE